MAKVFNPFTSELDYINLDTVAADARYLKLDQTTPQTTTGMFGLYSLAITGLNANRVLFTTNGALTGQVSTHSLFSYDYSVLKAPSFEATGLGTFGSLTVNGDVLTTLAAGKTFKIAHSGGDNWLPYTDGKNYLRGFVSIDQGFTASANSSITGTFGVTSSITSGATATGNYVKFDPTITKIGDIHGNLSFTSIPTPASTFTLTLGAAGASNVARQTWYRIRYKTADGAKTNGSNSQNITVTAAHERVVIGSIPQPTDPRVTKIEILKNTSDWWNWDYFFEILTTLDVGTTTYTDTSGDVASSTTTTEIMPYDSNKTSAMLYQDNALIMAVGKTMVTLGANAGYKGIEGVYIGKNAGASMPVGSSGNVIVGSSSGASATGGWLALFGTNAGMSATSSSAPTLIGGGAGQYVTTAAWPTMIGYRTGEKITTGWGNTALGFMAGSDESALGGAGVSGDYQYSTAIGVLAMIQQNRTITLGCTLAGFFPQVGIGTAVPVGHLDIWNLDDRVGFIIKGFSTQTNDLQQWKDSANNVLANVKGNGAFTPASMADASAANGTLYYSTTANRLVFKDSGGTVNNLY